MDWKEVLISGLMPVFKAAAKEQLKEGLKKLKEKHKPEVYAPALQGIYSGFKLLHEVALQTKTKIDDGVVDAISEAISEFCSDEGIVLV